MQQLYQARDSLEAQQLIDRLTDENIMSVVLGEHLAGGAGELSALNFPTVWVVENSHLLRARGVLKLFLLQQQQEAVAGSQAWTCSTCGVEVDAEFELCWNCGGGRG